MSDSVRPHRRQPTRLPRPWDSPDKNTGVGCHFLLQCMKVKSESEVTQSCRLLATPRTAAYQAPLSMGFSRQEYWSGVIDNGFFFISFRVECLFWQVPAYLIDGCSAVLIWVFLREEVSSSPSTSTPCLLLFTLMDP